MHIDNKLRYKTQSDLKLYKEKSKIYFFLESLNPKRKTIIGCIYKHLNLPVTEFTNDYMGPLLETFSLEKKK